MGAGGRSNPRDPDLKISDHDQQLINRAPTSKPPFTLADIKKAIPPHCFQRSLIRSFSYLVADLTAASIFYYLATTYIPHLPHPLPYLAWPVYWFIQGCVFMGIWLIAHECGHHAFSDHEWLEDTIGFIIHSLLMTPYFSWKISHRRHHANTGSLEHDEIYVPKTRSKLNASAFYLDNPIGRTLTLLVKLTLGWYIYLSINAAGRPYDKFASHYDPRSPIFSDNERVLILMSDVGLLSFSYLLYKVAVVQGFAWVFCVYGGALMVMNAFLVTITYLHHTHPSLPHYDDSEWNWIKGACATVDRDYGVLNKVFHNITDTHVLHHLFSYIPHYHAMEATKAIRPVLGEFYQSDSTPFFVALWRESKNCMFIETDEKNKAMANQSNMVMCSCGSPTQFATSWTNKNPGRRFHCCTKKIRNCGFVAWADPPMCDRSLQVIPGLLKRCNTYEAVALESVKQKKKLKFLLVISWVFFFLFVLFKLT